MSYLGQCFMQPWDNHLSAVTFMWNVSLDASFPLNEKDCYVSTVYKTAWYYYNMKIYLVWSYDDDFNFIPITMMKSWKLENHGEGEWTYIIKVTIYT